MSTDHVASLPLFDLDDVEDVDTNGEGNVAVRGVTSTVRCVRWRTAARERLFALKSVHLAREDMATDVEGQRECVAHIMRTMAQHNTFFCVPYRAVCIHDRHNFEWLMDWCTGRTLFTWCDRPLKDHTEWCRRTARQLCRAVYFLHETAHVVHGDLSLRNVMYDEKEGRLQLLDWEGCAAVGTAPSMAARTMLYSPPETVLGDDSLATGCADIWALGIMVFQLLSADSTRHPFVSEQSTQNASSFTAAMFTLASQPPAVCRLLPGASEDANAFLCQCLCWDPQHRATAGELLRLRWIVSQ